MKESTTYRDWKTEYWYATREDLFERIRSNKNLYCVDRWLLYDLSAQLLPFAQGGEWKKELHPGIYEQRRIDIAAWEEKVNLGKKAVWEHLNKLVVSPV